MNSASAMGKTGKAGMRHIKGTAKAKPVAAGVIS
jgi:hypothetical protein